MTKKKRNIFIIIGIFVIIAIFLAVFFFAKQSKKVPSKGTIEQNSLLTKTNRKVILNSKSILNSQKVYNLWEVENLYKLKRIEEIAANWGFETVSSIPTISYEWKKGDEYIFYDLVQNTVYIRSKELRKYTPSGKITNKTFSEIVKDLFDMDWTYAISRRRQAGEDIEVLYANRMLYDDVPINVNARNFETDHISLQGGEIGNVKIFIGSFLRNQEELPMLKIGELQEKLNSKDYPKVVYPNLNVLPEGLLDDFSYLNTTNDYFNRKTFENSINNCIQEGVLEVVYLYKYSEQGLLLPTYKLNAKCSATYKGKTYTVPALVFLNAIDPKYLKTETKK